MNATRCPDHYRFGPLQARDIIEQVIGPIRDAVRAYHTATALKYLLRHTRKAGIDDLLKCRDHLNWAIARAQGVPHERASDSVTWRHGDIDAVCGVPKMSMSVPTTGMNAPMYDPDAVAFRHGDIDAVCGVAKRECPSAQSGTHPMHHIALEMAENRVLRRVHDDWREHIGAGERCAKPQTVADEPWKHAP